VQENKGSWLITIYLILSIYLLPFPSSPKEMATWATSVSLSEQRSFDISWAKDFVAQDGSETIEREQKLYATGAPGLALIGSAIHSITSLFTGKIIQNPNKSNVFLSWLALRFFLSTLPLILLALWLYFYDVDEISMAILLFASPLFIYSLLLYGYVLTGILLYFSFRLLYDPQRIFLRNCFLAGLLSGFALLCDFYALICIAIMAISLPVVEKQERLPCVFSFLTGLLPCGVFLAIYNYSLFGSFFGAVKFDEILSVQNLSSVPYKLYLFLISPTYGLFFYAPILLLSVVLLFTSRERKTIRHKVKLALVVVSTFCFALFIRNEKRFAAGEFAILLPFLMDSFFDGELYDFSNIWLGLLFFVSFVFCTIPAMSFPLITAEFKYPHNNFWFKLLIEEKFASHTLLRFFGVENNFWLLIPTLILLGLVFHVVWRYARRPKRFLLGAFIGLLLVFTYLGLPNLDKPELKSKREMLKASH
jgi:hypothetical protein